MFKKILIANRGEIAVRVMQTCQRMGIGTVAVYSQGDRTALHPRFADEAVEIGPPPASESYLKVEKILEAAKATGAEAVHPGYGFLSENASFAEAAEAAGIRWIGPPTKPIELMGDKLTAREVAKKSNVPIVPGSEILASPEAAKKMAKEIGYPVLLKASAGGGGKGMRVVESEDEIENAFKRASSEAERSFGNPDMYMEKFVPHAKHIEVQVFSDTQGNHVWLGERECSIQRRHQKLIEESPSAAISEAQRIEMGEAAVALAKGCDYVNAGTVEFLYDADEAKFYFLEMNTRLQVEHPVTEMVTGQDLVEWQIRVANGEPLPLAQDQIQREGVAIECRLYAEDPIDFLPATGRLRVFLPPEGEGIRLDTGFEQGDMVGAYYDPLLSKFIVHGKDRMDAIEKLKRALDQFAIAGVTTNLAYHRAVVEIEDFQQGRHLTDFVETHPIKFDPTKAEKLILAQVVGQLYQEREQHLMDVLKTSPDGWPSQEVGA